MLSPGSVLAGTYEIVSEIGEGGFGKVYLGRDVGTGRRVAIKELSHELATTSPQEWDEYRARFQKEAQCATQFSHPNMVRVHALETDAQGDLYLILDYVDGGSLKELLESEGSLDIERILNISIDICDAIEAIYKRDIVHRDIKPSNILLTCDGETKLGGFGVAQVGDEARRTQEALGHPGTPAYKSPEQATSMGYLDQRSDLYSLGLVMYEMLTGHLYVGDHVPPHHYNSRVPSALDTVVMKAMQGRPTDRYQSAAQMRRDLEHVRDQSTPGQLQIVLGSLRRSRIGVIVTMLALLVLMTSLRWFPGVASSPTPEREAQPAALQVVEALPPTTTMEPQVAPMVLEPRTVLTQEGAPVVLEPTTVSTQEVATPEDPYEPDDEKPVPISIGETQVRVFHPEGDVDRVVLRVKAGRSYSVTTTDLGVGVDTNLEVLVGGQSLINDDAAPGSLASQVAFTALEDGTAVVTVSNTDRYGPERTYELSVEMVPTSPTVTPLPTSTSTPSPTATIRPTYTPRPTFTPGPTRTYTPTRTRTPTRTNTPQPNPTSTRTRTPTRTYTPSVTPLPTNTPSPSKTPTPDRTPLPVKTNAPPVQ